MSYLQIIIVNPQIYSNKKHADVLREIWVVSKKLQINITSSHSYVHHDENFLLEDPPLLSIINVECYIISKS